MQAHGFVLVARGERQILIHDTDVTKPGAPKGGITALRADDGRLLWHKALDRYWSWATPLAFAEDRVLLVTWNDVAAFRAVADPPGPEVVWRTAPSALASPRGPTSDRLSLVITVGRSRLGAREGLAAGAAAYALWGIFPIYFKALASVPPVEILAHRVVWALLFLGLVVRRQHLGGEVRAALRPGRSLVFLTSSALLIAANWLVYIFAVVTGRILEGSFGYFINPLISVLLGVVFLGERLDRATWLAVGFAAGGVAFMTIRAGQLPWLALAVAVSFGGYGMLRKIAPVGAVVGLTVETLLLFPLACGYLVWSGLAGTLSLGSGGRGLDLLLVLAGPLTVIPLLLFTGAARRLPLSMLGLLQYLSPTLQLIVGVFLYGEHFSSTRAIGFGCIWIGLAIFVARTLRHAAFRRSGGVE